ncbi:PqqD family protein [Thermoactinomyces mirandus]|uniref:PqqD family protein n=1 Tax=Thermoactinomyces mirandus TaxID=2756294 RepID=A0A7W1XTF6_9BACL|nr:PqqD family protein [Thermoactinomyces mirandus]MBA4602755.1 PqqD family protein [Thermoactinomyces mirandus]
MLNKKRTVNLLELLPSLKPCLTVEQVEGEKKAVYIVIPRTSWIERFSVRFLKQPPVNKVRLDQIGSFVIQLCDGKHTVGEIMRKVELEFGEKAEPTLPRLAKFLEIIEANGWIEWKE